MALAANTQHCNVWLRPVPTSKRGLHGLQDHHVRSSVFDGDNPFLHRRVQAPCMPGNPYRLLRLGAGDVRSPHTANTGALA